jgi:hypothetical protein
MEVSVVVIVVLINVSGVRGGIRNKLDFKNICSLLTLRDWVKK